MEARIRIPSGSDRVAVVGPAERNLKMLREGLGIRIAARDDSVVLIGESTPVEAARMVLEELVSAAPRALSRAEVLDLIAGQLHRALNRASNADATQRVAGAGWDGVLDVRAGGLPVRPKTPNQQVYLDAIRDHEMVFGIGPAGTGKTYLAVAAAVHLLKTGRVSKLCLVRPAVEAGEKLGFLPGDLQEKVNPYLRPLLDALQDMLSYQTLQKFMMSDVIEIAPLAFMRGRTLNGAVVILDEAQNTTRSQMKMFLTRMGHGSKVIVTGDSTQIDLPDPLDSGLVDAARRLRRVPGVAFVGLSATDVVRHRLVQSIVEAYGGEETHRRGAEELRRAMAGEDAFESESEIEIDSDASPSDKDGLPSDRLTES